MDDDRRATLGAQLASLPVQWVAGFPLHLAADGVVGRYFKCELRSHFYPYDLGGVSITRGVLAVQGPDGAPFSPDSLFKLASGADGLLQLDRLCRLIHALNHFIVAGRSDPLLISVHARLFGYVKVAHGRTFARMLAHFDLSPSRVVLEVPSELPQRTLENYLSAGFAVHLARHALVSHE